MPPKPRYAPHAVKRMQQRGIAEADVEMALRRRIGQPGPGQPGTMWIRGHAVGGRILKVAVFTTDTLFVQTAVWAD